MKFELPDKLYSLAGLIAVVAELKAYGVRLQQSEIKQRVAGTEAAAEVMPLSEPAAALIKTLPVPVTAESLAGLVASLEHLGDTAPRITLTLAAPAPEALKKTLVTWLRREINPNLLVNFGFSNGLLGGAVVRTGSHMLDWSFRSQILAEREKFAEILRRV